MAVPCCSSARTSTYSPERTDRCDRQSCGVVDRRVDPVGADASGAFLLSVAGDEMPHLAEAGRLLDVDVDQLAWCLALVALDRRLGLQISQPAQAQAVRGPGQGGKRSGQNPGDVTQLQPLMAQLHSALEAVRIEHPPLGAANTASIRQGGWTT